MARSFSASPEELKQSWLEFGAGLMHIVQDIFLQRLRASHLPKSLKLPPLSNFSCIVTGCTSGIGLHVAQYVSLEIWLDETFLMSTVTYGSTDAASSRKLEHIWSWLAVIPRPQTS